MGCEENKLKMDEFAHFVYKMSRKFPREEIFGITSQIRRASLSVALNYIEGFARRKNKAFLNFLEISYGSLKESKYLLHFSLKEGDVREEDYKQGMKMAEEIGAMLWSPMKTLETKIK